MTNTKKPRVSPAMLRVLENLQAGRHPFCHVFGRSAAGGATATEFALYKHGLAAPGTGNERMIITDAGRAALAAALNR